MTHQLSAVALIVLGRSQKQRSDYKTTGSPEENNDWDMIPSSEQVGTGLNVQHEVS